MSFQSNEDVIFASSGYSLSIRFYHPHNGVCYKTLSHNDSHVNDLALSPDRKHIAAAGYQHVKVYDLPSSNPNPILSFDGISKNIVEVGYQEDGQWMFTAGEDGTVRVWDLRAARSSTCSRMLQLPAAATCIALHPNQGELLIGDQAGQLHIWDLAADNTTVMTPAPEVAIRSVAVDLEATLLAVVNNKGDCYLWNLVGGRSGAKTVVNNRRDYHLHKRYILHCTFSPDSTLLATTSADQTAKLWRTADMTLLVELTHPDQRWVWDAAFSQDSQYLFTASSDCKARLWSIDTGKVVQEYRDHDKAVTCLALHDTPSSGQ